MAGDSHQTERAGEDVEGQDRQVAVVYTTARRGERKVEKGAVLAESPFQHRSPGADEVYVAVEERDVVLRVPVHGGNVYALHHATARHDVRQGRLVDLVPAGGGSE